MILHCGLEDDGFSGSSYTWINGQVSKQLDRVLINAMATNFCRWLNVMHLNWTSSDH